MGIKRAKAKWGYTWITNMKPPFKLQIDPNDPEEYEHRLRLAQEHLEEARKAFRAEALVAAAHEAQLAIENAAKSIIAMFKPPSWTHNPAPELIELVRTRSELLSGLEEYLKKLASIVEEVAPHHALTSYGDIRRMVTPVEIYKREVVKDMLVKAEEAVRIARKVLREVLSQR